VFFARRRTDSARNAFAWPCLWCVFSCAALPPNAAGFRPGAAKRLTANFRIRRGSIGMRLKLCQLNEAQVYNQYSLGWTNR
jgi:hypothetical protein